MQSRHWTPHNHFPLGESAVPQLQEKLRESQAWPLRILHIPLLSPIWHLLWLGRKGQLCWIIGQGGTARKLKEDNEDVHWASIPCTALWQLERDSWRYQWNTASEEKTGILSGIWWKNYCLILTALCYRNRSILGQLSLCIKTFCLNITLIASRLLSAFKVNFILNGIWIPGDHTQLSSAKHWTIPTNWWML